MQGHSHVSGAKQRSAAAAAGPGARSAAREDRGPSTPQRGRRTAAQVLAMPMPHLREDPTAV
jgi:hypothetical protein